MLATSVAAFVIVAMIVSWFGIRPMLRLRAMTRAGMQTGTPVAATVISSVQKSISSSGVSKVEIALDLHGTGQPPRRVTARQMIGLGTLPQPGETVYVLADMKDSKRYSVLAGHAPVSTEQSPAVHSGVQQPENRAAVSTNASPDSAPRVNPREDRPSQSREEAVRSDDDEVYKSHPGPRVASGSRSNAPLPFPVPPREHRDPDRKSPEPKA